MCCAIFNELCCCCWCCEESGKVYFLAAPLLSSIAPAADFSSLPPFSLYCTHFETDIRIGAGPRREEKAREEKRNSTIESGIYMKPRWWKKKGFFLLLFFLIFSLKQNKRRASYYSRRNIRARGKDSSVRSRPAPSARPTLRAHSLRVRVCVYIIIIRVQWNLTKKLIVSHHFHLHRSSCLSFVFWEKDNTSRHTRAHAALL